MKTIEAGNIVLWWSEWTGHTTVDLIVRIEDGEIYYLSGGNVWSMLVSGYEDAMYDYNESVSVVK